MHAAWTMERLRTYIGVHLSDLFRDVFPAYSPAEIGALIERYRDAYHAREHASTRMFPGVREALGALSGRKAVATSRRTDTTHILLKRFGIDRYFEFVQGADGVRSKPAPDIVLGALAGLGARPGDCLMVGDSPADILAARAAGVRTCIVDYGYGDRAAIDALQPDYRISHLRDLLPAVHSAGSPKAYTTPSKVVV